MFNVKIKQKLFKKREGVNYMLLEQQKNDYNTYIGQSFKLLFSLFLFFLIFSTYIEIRKKEQCRQEIFQADALKVSYSDASLVITEDKIAINHQSQTDKEIEKLMKQILKEMQR